MADVAEITSREKYKILAPKMYEEVVRVIYNEDYAPEETVIDRLFEVLDKHTKWERENAKGKTEGEQEQT